MPYYVVEIETDVGDACVSVLAKHKEDAKRVAFTSYLSGFIECEADIQYIDIYSQKLEEE